MKPQGCAASTGCSLAQTSARPQHNQKRGQRWFLLMDKPLSSLMKPFRCRETSYAEPRKASEKPGRCTGGMTRVGLGPQKWPLTASYPLDAVPKATLPWVGRASARRDPKDLAPATAGADSRSADPNPGTPQPRVSHSKPRFPVRDPTRPRRIDPANPFRQDSAPPSAPALRAQAPRARNRGGRTRPRHGPLGAIGPQGRDAPHGGIRNRARDGGRTRNAAWRSSRNRSDRESP